VIAAVAVAVAACAARPAGSGSAGSGTGPAVSGVTAPTAAVLATARQVSCPPLHPMGQLRSAPTAGVAIPAGFRAVAVVRCIPAGAIAPAQGQGAYMRKELAISGLGPLLAALREPSARRAGLGLVSGCPVPAPRALSLALIGPRNAIVYARVPITECGLPRQAVLASLSSLHWIVISNPAISGDS
jgi:hypothetical protein